MGIKDINKFFKDKKLDFLKEADASKFSGKRVAIDSYSIFIRLAARTHEKLISGLKNPLDNYSPRLFFNNFMKYVLVEMMFFLKNGISIIFVFEGEKDPDKQDCLEERREKRNILRDKILVAEEEYLVCINNPLEYGNPDEYEKKLKKLRAQDFFFDKNWIPEIRQTFERIGIPCVTAQYDSEFLCCNLILEGKADSVYTTDTDCYAFGINYMITEINTYANKCMISDIDVMINFFSIEMDVDIDIAIKSLRDFCIMCGCDFNKRYPQIGPVKSFNLLKKYKRLFLITEKDFSCLKNEVCRDKFSYNPTGISSDEVEMNWGKLVSNGYDVFSQFDSQELNYSLTLVENNVLRR